MGKKKHWEKDLFQHKIFSSATSLTTNFIVDASHIVKTSYYNGNEEIEKENKLTMFEKVKSSFQIFPLASWRSKTKTCNLNIFKPQCGNKTVHINFFKHSLVIITVKMKWSSGDVGLTSPTHRSRTTELE